MLLWGLFVVRCIGFSRYAGRLGTPSKGEYIGTAVQDQELLRAIRWSITSINRLFGSRFNCLMQGIAAKLMLNRRGIDNTLVLGTKFSPSADGSTPVQFEAHAWLWAGQAILVGGEERHGYIPMTSYHSP